MLYEVITMRDQAERLKCTYGVALSDRVSDDEEIAIPGIRNNFV